MNETKEKKGRKKIQKQFHHSPEVQRIAEKVIENENLDLMGASIAYLSVSPYIAKTVAGRCIKSNPELKFYSQSDYIIEVSSNLWDKLDEETKYILLYHELLHCDPQVNENTGEVKYLLRSHDIEDFREIVSKYGVDWLNTMEVLNSELHSSEDDIFEGRITL